MVEMEVEEGTVESWREVKGLIESMREGERLILCEMILTKSGRSFVVREGALFTLVYTITKEEAIDLVWYWVKKLKCNKYIKTKNKK